MPSTNGIQIDNLPDKWEVLNQFLLNSISNGQPSLSVNKFFARFTTSWSPYIFSLKEAATKFTIKIEIFHMMFSYDEFWSFMESAKRVWELGFLRWTLQTDLECDFGEMKWWKIKQFRFNNSGDNWYSNWDEWNERLFNILKGITDWEDLCSSLRKFELKYNTTDENKNKLILSIEEMFPTLEHRLDLQFKFKGDNRLIP